MKKIFCSFIILIFLVSFAFAGAMQSGTSFPRSPVIRGSISFGTATTLSDGDTTPSVSGDANFLTANTGATTISRFDDLIAGELFYVLIDDANTTFDFTTSNLYGNGGSDYSAAENDLLGFYSLDGINCFTTFIGKAAGGSGETNTASNVGTDGVGVWYQKTGVDLEFRNIAPASNKVTVSLNGQDIDIDITEANINHDSLSGFVANEHIDWTQDQGATNIHAGNYTDDQTAAEVSASTSNFAGNLSVADDTVQKALDTLDDVAIPTATSLSVDDIITLSGVAEGAQHLGTFTGSTIADSVTIKAALQELETAVEGLGGGHDAVTLSTDLGNNLLGLSTQQLTLDNQTANYVFAGPATGEAAAPTFRALVSGDIPDLSGTYLGVSAKATDSDTLDSHDTSYFQVALTNPLVQADVDSTPDNGDTGTPPSEDWAYKIENEAMTFYGIKTFDSFPITPSSAPTTDYQAANKKYVDDNIGPGDMAKSVYDTGDNGKVDDADAVTHSDASDQDATYYLVIVDGATGTQVPMTDGGITYNPSTNTFTITGTITAPSYNSSAADGSRISYLPENTSGNEPTPDAGKAGFYFYDGLMKFFWDYTDTVYTFADFTVATDWDTWAEHPAVPSAQILVGNGSNQPAPVAMSGDIHIDNTGATVIQPAVVAPSMLDTSADDDAIEFVIDGGGTAITTGVKGFLEIPYACTISRVTLLADQSTSTVIDLWVDSYANYPPDNDDSITDAGTSPTITTATKSQDSTLTSWTTSLTKGQIIGFNVDSNDNAERITVSIGVDK
jgi:hypothetical protein